MLSKGSVKPARSNADAGEEGNPCLDLVDAQAAEAEEQHRCVRGAGVVEICKGEEIDPLLAGVFDDLRFAAGRSREL